MKFVNNSEGGNMFGSHNSDNDVLDKWWDSDSRKSPFSTVADPDDDDYCEECESTVDYSDPSVKHGKCRCES